MAHEVRVDAVAGLTQAERDEMWAFASSFMDASREVFEQTVAAKEHLYRVRRIDTGELLGIGAFRVREVEFQGQRHVVVFTGNTLFREELRGNDVIQRLGLETWVRAKLRWPTARIWLFFDTFSYKSYVMCPRNLDAFWPRRDRETPGFEAALLDHLAELHFGAHWDRDAQVVHPFARRRLQSSVAPIDRLDDPDIRFFAERNPGWSDGDTLPVLAPLDLGNWLAIARNALRRAWRRRGSVTAPALVTP